ncbi:MAG: hypothetical protein ACR2LO_03195 [Ilumatobacteraceae bacterium]
MTDGNPLLELHRTSGGSAAGRHEAIRLFAFAVPDDAALAVIVRSAPTGVIELGAGTGYWAHLLAQRGVDVVAFDPTPAPSAANPWFAGAEPWFPVRVGDADVIDHHARRCLLLVWPTRNETWPAAVIERFHACGGHTVFYVGEGPGGRTGDELFHRLIGEIDHCQHCAYGLIDHPCICGITPLFEPVGHHAIPTWHGFDDRLVILRRTEATIRQPQRRHRLLARIRSRTRPKPRRDHALEPAPVRSTDRRPIQTDRRDVGSRTRARASAGLGSDGRQIGPRVQDPAPILVAGPIEIEGLRLLAQLLRARSLG